MKHNSGGTGETLGYFYCNAQRQLAYLRIPKCGCTTIEKWMATMHPHYVRDPGIRIHSEEAARRYFSEVCANELKLHGLLKFTFVRNPYSRFLSFYRDKIAGPRAEPHIFENLGRFGVHHGMPLAECARRLAQVEDHSKLNPHVAPLHLFLLRRGKLRVDFIGRLEHFDQGIRVISSFAGVAPPDLHLNKTPLKKAVLDSDSKREVHRLYARDFELLGYRP